MRIQYTSDIHLECLKILPEIKVMADVLCIAGDIGDPYTDIYAQFLIKLSVLYKKVFIITGNNDYYSLIHSVERPSITDTDSQINFVIQSHELDNITFLNNSSEEYEGYIFVGGTLWSDISNLSESDTLYRPDFTRISELTFENYNILHQKSVEYIKYITAKTHCEAQSDKNYLSKKMIIITHHLPTYLLMKTPLKTEQEVTRSKFYASHCDYLFEKPITAWIYGHTHIPGTDFINNIQFVSNPRCNTIKHNTITFAVLEV
jgi:predicted phosphodiesterase